MEKRAVILAGFGFCLLLLLVACSTNPQPAGLTPVSTLLPAETLTPIAALPGTVSPGTGSPGVLPPISSPVPPGQGDAAVGAQLYERNCTLCHGIQGQGVDAPPLQNSNFVATAGNAAIMQVIADGRPGTEMPGWLQDNGGPLAEPAIADLVAYLQALQGVAPSGPSQGLPGTPSGTTAAPATAGPGTTLSAFGNADQGQPLFGQVCAPCHGPQGVQGIPNPGSTDGTVPQLNPIDPSLATAGAIGQFIMHGSVPEGSSPQLAMPAYGDLQLLTQQQIADLAAYILAANGKQ